MIRRPPKSTRTDTLVPYTTLFRSHIASFRLKVSCDFRIHAVMAINIRDIFDEIGGAAKVARLMNAPVTTVWAWQKSNRRSEEHTSELQSLMRISYAVFCLKKKTNTKHNKTYVRPEQEYDEQK